MAQCLNNCNPKYADIPNLLCVVDCPDGWTESATGNTCIKTEFCHSTCDTCATKNDIGQCSACSTTLTTLTYDSLSGNGQCTIPTLNNGQYLMTINKNTALGATSKLQSVNYNSLTQSTSGTLLGSFLYK